MKRPFEIGDRVRVYGAYLNPPKSAKGKVKLIHPGGDVRVVLDDGVNASFFPQQCRRLKPAKPVKKEARRVYLAEDDLSKLTGKTAPPICHGYISRLKHETFCEEFREVLPGEIVVTREALAKAIQEYWQTPSDEPHTWAVCAREVAKALGLES